MRVSHGQDDHVEPCLAVNPRDPRKLLVVCAVEDAAPATYSSFDGGRTWRSNGPLPLPAGVVTGGNNTVGFDGAGRGLVCSLLTGLPSPTAPKGAGFSVGVWRTDDGGRTFTPPVAVSGTGAFDHPWLATERRRPHAVHVVWTEGATLGLNTAVSYARSTDGGQAFEAPRHADILVAASRDGGRSWSRAAAVTPRDQIIYFEPQVAIDAAGRIGVMGLAMTHGKVSVVLMLSEPHSLRFGRPITITNHPFDPAKSDFGRRWFIGDYQALATTPGAFHPLWTDTHAGRLQLFTASVQVSR